MLSFSFAQIFCFWIHALFLCLFVYNTSIYIERFWSRFSRVKCCSLLSVRFLLSLVTSMKDKFGDIWSVPSVKTPPSMTVQRPF